MQNIIETGRDRGIPETGPANSIAPFLFKAHAEKMAGKSEISGMFFFVLF